MCNQIPTNSNQIVEIKSIILQNTNLYIIIFLIGRIKLSNINENCIELSFMYDSSHRANALL